MASLYAAITLMPPPLIQLFTGVHRETGGRNLDVGSIKCSNSLVVQHLFVGHVGDSGAFCIRDGAARRLTMDHKPTNPAESKRIANAGGTVRTPLSPLSLHPADSKRWVAGTGGRDGAGHLHVVCQPCAHVDMAELCTLYKK